MAYKTHTSRRALLQFGTVATMWGAFARPASAQSITTEVDSNTVSSSRQTPLGLYLRPQDAHAAMRSNPAILFVDVRDPIEITFVGHPDGLDKIIPLRVASHDVNPESGQYRMVDNPNVLGDFAALLAYTDKTKSSPIFVTCRSGSRSAAAARMLIEDGYTNVWNLVEGFEGDKDADGARALNGWRNAGMPWGYRLGEGVAWG